MDFLDHSVDFALCFLADLLFNEKHIIKFIEFVFDFRRQHIRGFFSLAFLEIDLFLDVDDLGLYVFQFVFGILFVRFVVFRKTQVHVEEFLVNLF